MKKDKYHQHHHSHLFTVQVWQEELDNDQSEWRSKVQHVHSGEALYFREWPALITALLKILSEAQKLESYPETE